MHPASSCPQAVLDFPEWPLPPQGHPTAILQGSHLEWSFPDHLLLPPCLYEWSLPVFSPPLTPGIPSTKCWDAAAIPGRCNTYFLLHLKWSLPGFRGSLPRPPAYGLLLPSLATLRFCLKWSLLFSLDFPLPTTGWSLPALEFPLFTRHTCGCKCAQSCLTLWDLMD